MSSLDPCESENGEAVEHDGLPDPIHIRGLRAMTAILMFAMMTLGFSDVVMRYLFDAPIYGAAPMIGMLLGLVVFSSLPLISRDNQHITVDLFERLFSGRLGRAAEWFVDVFNIGATAFIADRMWSFGTRRYESGQLHDMIDLQLWPFAISFAVLATLTSILLVVRLWSRLGDGRGARARSAGSGSSADAL